MYLSGVSASTTASTVQPMTARTRPSWNDPAARAIVASGHLRADELVGTDLRHPDEVWEEQANRRRREREAAPLWQRILTPWRFW